MLCAGSLLQRFFRETPSLLRGLMLFLTNYKFLQDTRRLRHLSVNSRDIIIFSQQILVIHVVDAILVQDVLVDDPSFDLVDFKDLPDQLRREVSVWQPWDRLLALDGAEELYNFLP